MAMKSDKRPHYEPDFAKVDSILRHLQQTESHDWLGEITHWGTQVCYLLLQNYNITRLNIQSSNFHLILLTTFFFAQRIWFFLWRMTQFSDAHGVRFACHLTLFFVMVDSLYCGLTLAMQDSFAGVYLALPLLLSVLFYHGYLKSQTNVFTAELFNMLRRCVYHSLEAAYCIGVLPLRFVRYDYIYYDTSRCAFLTFLVTVHIFLSFLCLELHCLGSEALQQTRMLGEWRRIAEPGPKQGKPAEWSSYGGPYPRGAVVLCKGRYYEALAAQNTCMPTSLRLWPIVFILGDSQRAKAFMLVALLMLNMVLVQLVLWSNQWIMYAIMIIPNAIHFLYVKLRKTHSFFNPAHLNLRQLQWDLRGMPPGQSDLGKNCRGALDRGWASGLSKGLAEMKHRHNGELGNHFADSFGDSSCPDPLFMSAVAASTSFFFGNAGSTRYPDLAPS
ncbi:unnamed protein product [Effrenium voratum]|uniref:Uncharacterized protein n=1 Tax=Effrenium voratum TaxID=2562239 RepID=A0AA36JTQ3_9DINO|nr:unnamed protein product [Effrenium voratum]CAJ1411294.1 unnamed protein product [Effrenium voratum]CAJ1425723.1 unnamed protein product [Effrenium voratum]